MTLVNTRPMAEEGAKHKNMDMRLLSTRTMQLRLLSKRTMANEVAKHKNNGK